jgi:hypothetical protein
MTVRAAWLQPTGQTREDTRLTLAALLTPSGESAEATPLRSRAGIVPGGFTLTGISAMQCSIGTGHAIIQGIDTDQGAYLVAVTAPETLTIADGDPAHGRIDLIELAVIDDAYDNTGVTQAVVRLVKGTPSAAPAAPPSGPGSAIPLYTVSVPAGTSAGTGGIAWNTAAVTTLHWPVVALGGIMPTSGFKGAYIGQYRDSGGQLQRWDGSAWLRATILFSASQTATQSVDPSTWTTLTLQSIDVDEAAGWNGSTTYTVPRTGWWRVSAHAVWANDSQTGMRGARLLVNGVGVPRTTWLTPAGNGAVAVGGQGLIKLTAGSTLTLAGYQTHTAAVKTLGGSGYACNLSAEWIKS